MQTFVAFAGTPSPPGWVLSHIARVEAHYARMHASACPTRSFLHDRAGIVLWSSPTVESHWPGVAQRGRRAVVTPYPPLGVERLVAASTAAAPFDLVDLLMRAPARISDLTPPFVAAAVDGGDLDLFTDALGIGRLFEVRTPWGWVWSNRPMAAALFAGIPVRPDPEGWVQSAVADEFYGSITPLAGVRAVGPGTHLHWDARSGRLTSSAIDVTTALTVCDPQARLDDLVEEAAADLVATTASISRWYPGTPVVDLSGGRDSRLVAAGFIAGGTEVNLHSHDAVPGDLLVAQDLVSRLPHAVPHTVTHMSTGTTAPPRRFAALESARAWHAYAEGLRPCTYLHYNAPGTLDRTGAVVVGGAGGEAAHGYYYGGSDGAAEQTFAAELEEAVGDPAAAVRALRAHAERIVRRHCPVPGVTDEARVFLAETIAADLLRLHRAGVPGATVLDHFYVGERMRRWGSSSERRGIASPLFTPSFQRAALALRPRQRRANVLHRMLTERLVPAWSGVPYFPGEVPATATRPATPPRVIRLADCTDAEEVEAVLASPDDRFYPFDPVVLAAYWQASLTGETTAVQERVLRSAVWRAAFDDHVADATGEAPPVRTGRILPAEEATGPEYQVEHEASPEPADPTVTAVLLQTAAVRRIGRSTAWSMVRETPAGRYVRRVVARRR